MLVEFVAITLKIESVKTEIVPLLSCNKDNNGNHKFSNKLNESSCKSESLRRRFHHPYKGRGARRTF